MAASLLLSECASAVLHDNIAHCAFHVDIVPPLCQLRDAKPHSANQEHALLRWELRNVDHAAATHATTTLLLRDANDDYANATYATTRNCSLRSHRYALLKPLSRCTMLFIFYRRCYYVIYYYTTAMCDLLHYTNIRRLYYEEHSTTATTYGKTYM